MKNITFNRDVIKPGMILLVQSNGRFGKLLRGIFNHWIKRLCEEYDLEFEEAFSSHTAEFVNPKVAETVGMAIGESLVKGGSVYTSIDEYERRMSKGEIEVKVCRVKGISDHDQMWAAYNWAMNIYGRPYNYMGFPRLLIKALLFDWSDIEPKNTLQRAMKRIGDKAAGWEWAEWCTEGVDYSYRKWKPWINIFQTKNSTPLSGDQAAGLCPRKPGKKITLEIVEDAIIEL